MKNYRLPHALMVSMLTASAALIAIAPPAHASDAQVETIVMVRHGEKPADGLGQLTCQGLNRALALPRVIEAKYGKPDAIFAPDPAKQKDDRGTKYDYVRPLATIEPTAIYFGLPVDASVGFADVDGLRAALLAPAYRNSRVVVAWEHSVLEAFVRRVVADYGGDPAQVRHWPSDDFDSIYVLRITHGASGASAALSVEREHLDHRSKDCPGE